MKIITGTIGLEAHLALPATGFDLPNLDPENGTPLPPITLLVNSEAIQTLPTNIVSMAYRRTGAQGHTKMP